MASFVTTREARTRLPRLVYGTAWKKERSADLVYEALCTGFRGVDTANQPRHYREADVAQGVRRALADGAFARSDLYLQTKFTAPGGQDHDGPDKAPYDLAAPIDKQVLTSIKSSLRNFTFYNAHGQSESYLDCLVFHAPLDTDADTVAALRVVKMFVPDRIRTVGLSNTDLGSLRAFVAAAHQVEQETPVLPAGTLCPVVVQNRFHTHRHHPDPYDVHLRAFCARPEHRIVYQSFWTLTANPKLLASAFVQSLAHAVGVEREAAFYSLVALGLGGLNDGNDGNDGKHAEIGSSPAPVVVLDGTTTTKHMADDLAGIESVRAWAQASDANRGIWDTAVAAFKTAIGEA